MKTRLLWRGGAGQSTDQNIRNPTEKICDNRAQFAVSGEALAHDVAAIVVT